MHKIKEAVIVEGIYDKNKLEGFLDGVILTTHGFAVYSNEDFVKTIQRLADTVGIVILTDSDSAGMRIRNFIKQKVDPSKVKHAYVPDIHGTERRKRNASAEGLLGVEGMSESVIINALREAGCSVDDETCEEMSAGITKADLYALGLTGGIGAKELRGRLSHEIGVPAKLSTNMLLEVLNRTVSREELVDIVQKIKDKKI